MRFATRVVAVLLPVVLCIAGSVRSASAASPVEGPAVYFSDSPNLCANVGGVRYALYVHAPEGNRIVGLRLDLELGTGAPGPLPQPVVYGEPGVTLVVSDVSQMPYHIEALGAPVRWCMNPSCDSFFRRILS